MLEVLGYKTGHEYDIGHELGNALQPIIIYGEFNDRELSKDPECRRPGPYETHIRSAHSELIERFWDIKSRYSGLPAICRLNSLLAEDMLVKENRDRLFEEIKLLKGRR